MTILMLIGMVFVIIWEMFHGRISLNSVLLLLLLLNFVSGFWLEFPCQKYQVKSHHSSPWFSAAWAAAIVHRNHFFHLHQKDKSPECKIKLRQVSNHCKRVLEAAKLAYANKTKKSITSLKLGSRDLWQIANNVLKGKSACYTASIQRTGCVFFCIW